MHLRLPRIRPHEYNAMMRKIKKNTFDMINIMQTVYQLNQRYDKASWIEYAKFWFPNSIVFLLFFNFKEKPMLVPREFFQNGGIKMNIWYINW